MTIENTDHDTPHGTAIVHFRRLTEGSRYYRPGCRRGWWRVLVVKDRRGSYAITAKNVTAVLYNGPEGLDGVTEKSQYYIGDSHEEATAIARAYNERTRGVVVCMEQSVVDPCWSVGPEGGQDVVTNQ